MKLHLLSGLMVCSMIFISCSSTAETTSPAVESGSSVYPSWYSATRDLFRSDDGAFFLAYGMAVAVDSTSAVRKAGREAASNLEGHISGALESIREEASRQNGSLSEPAFIFELRRAETVVSGAAEVARTATRLNVTHGSYYGFAEVRISREELLIKLDEAFGSRDGAWGAMKESTGFTGW